MILETAVLAAVVIGVGLLVGLLFSIVRGSSDDAVLFLMALLTGLTVWAGIIALILAVVCACRGDYRKGAFAVIGWVVGILLFAGVAAMLVAGLGETV